MCRNAESNPDFLLCKEDFEEVYTECTASCGIGEYLCISTCVREYEDNLEKCPCQTDCPHGCPCPNYQCQISTTLEDTVMTTPVPVHETVLVLSTKLVNHVPLLTDDNGREDRNFFFMYGQETVVHYSCGLSFQNEFYIFGGINEHQISKVASCRLDIVGQLSFRFVHGGCTSGTDNLVYLCFGEAESTSKRCHFARSPEDEFQRISDSNFSHRLSRIASSTSMISLSKCFYESRLLADVLAVGGRESIKAEMLLIARNTWITINDYPFVKDVLQVYLTDMLRF